MQVANTEDTNIELTLNQVIYFLKLKVNKDFLQGLFMAPSAVKGALKGKVLAAKLFEDLGFEVSPKHDSNMSDIVIQIY